ncbi:unnamed protein product [Pleuronectes platessa]|uniref:Uncharacterized protein n=1 Tax=Pleuronectes platessa TaxID=8262 RepID=A0A9N7VC23_PLEPL|nr:unnamed protein product [Pleuronectes platessa]
MKEDCSVFLSSLPLRYDAGCHFISSILLDYTSRVQRNIEQDVQEGGRPAPLCPPPAHSGRDIILGAPGLFCFPFDCLLQPRGSLEGRAFMLPEPANKKQTEPVGRSEAEPRRPGAASPCCANKSPFHFN